MRILLNGEAREFAVDDGVLSVQGLLDALGLDARTVAVEVDRVVVKRERYAMPAIREGAEVEIVAFVGGGHNQREHGRRQPCLQAGKRSKLAP